jgi:catechol 2,3-dioxygenase-like lactoylglutathione lyase family enzyme
MPPPFRPVARPPPAPSRPPPSAASCRSRTWRGRVASTSSRWAAPSGEKPDGKFVYQVGATEIALFPRPEGTRATHTALSFRVADIAAAVRALKARGVDFADYDLPGLKTVEHVCVLGAEKAAWFSDPEGNILCLHEDIA